MITNGAEWAKSGVFTPVSRALSGHLPLIGRTFPLESATDTAAPCHVLIRQGAGGEQPVGVLHEPFVSHLHEAEEAEDVFDHADGVLNPGVYARLVSVLRPLDFINGTLAPTAPVGHVFRFGRTV